MWSDLEFKKRMCSMRKGKPSPHKGKIRPELVGKSIAIINDYFSKKIIEMYKIMGTEKIAEILKLKGFQYGRYAIVGFLKRRGLYTREGKKGPFGSNILQKDKNGRFMSKNKC